MPNGNQSSENLGHDAVAVDDAATRLVDPSVPLSEIVESILGRTTGAGPGRVVVFGAHAVADSSRYPPLTDRQVAARCSTMTDAIKRVDGPVVLETVDRNELRIVDYPVVVPMRLARRWAEHARNTRMGGRDRASGGVLVLAELLSDLSAVEPDLIVLDLQESDH